MMALPMKPDTTVETLRPIQPGSSPYRQRRVFALPAARCSRCSRCCQLSSLQGPQVPRRLLQGNCDEPAARSCEQHLFAQRPETSVFNGEHLRSILALQFSLKDQRHHLAADPGLPELLRGVHQAWAEHANLAEVPASPVPVSGRSNYSSVERQQTPCRRLIARSSKESRASHNLFLRFFQLSEASFVMFCAWLLDRKEPERNGRLGQGRAAGYLRPKPVVSFFL